MFARHLANHFANLMAKRPRTVLAAAGVIAILCALLTVLRLEFQPNRNDLLDPNIEWNAWFIDWRENFKGTQTLAIAIDNNSAQPQQVSQAATAIVRTLNASKAFDHVSWGAKTSAYAPKTAHLLPLNDFTQRIGQAANTAPLIRAHSTGHALQNMVLQLRQQTQPSQNQPKPIPHAANQQLAALTNFLNSTTQSLAAQNQDQATQAMRAALRLPKNQNAWTPFTSPTNRYTLIYAQPKLQTNQSDQLNTFAAPAIIARQAVQTAKQTTPTLRAGVVGIDVMEADETHAAIRDSTLASIITLVLVTSLLIAAFGSLRKPLLIMLTMGFAIAWSFGYLTLAVGHLQVLSAVFVVILLGLGVDFGIHLVSTLEQLRQHDTGPRETFDKAIAKTLRAVGPGLVVAAITTAAAFATTAFTPFRGVAELGIIAAGGVLLCLVAMVTVLPALLRLYGGQQRDVKQHNTSRWAAFQDSWLTPVLRRPWLTITAFTVVSVALAFAASSLRFGYDLVELQPRGSQSVAWQTELREQGGLSIWQSAIVCEDLDHARRLAKQLRELPQVSRVGGIGLLFPEDEDAKLALAGAARAQLEAELGSTLTGSVKASPTSPLQLRTQLKAMSTLLNIARGTGTVPASLAAELAQVDRAIGLVQQQFDQLAPEEFARALERTDLAFLEAQSEVVKNIEGLLSAEPLAVSDFPADVLRSFIAEDGRVVLTVQPAVPEHVQSPLDPDVLSDFTRAVAGIAPHATGVIFQIARTGDLIFTSFRMAGFAAMGVVFVIVFLAFRNVLDALLVLVPVVFGFLLGFGGLALMGGELNLANVIVLPLLFGIGVDAGVHIIHRGRDRSLGDGARSPAGLGLGTGKGVVLTLLTSIICFASLLFASHGGIRSIGVLMTLGLVGVLVSSLTLLPAVLGLRLRAGKAMR